MDSLEEKHSKIETGSDTSSTEKQIEVLKELVRIQKRNPGNLRRRKAYRIELENLARNNPGISFPGSEALKLDTSEEQTRQRLLREALREIFLSKLKRNCLRDRFPNVAAKVLLSLNQLQKTTITDLVQNSGLKKCTARRAVQALIDSGIAEHLRLGRSGFYILSAEGKELIKRLPGS